MTSREMDIETRVYFRELRARRAAERRTNAERARVDAEVAAWNAAHPVGTPVRFWPWTRDGEGRPGRTRSVAWAPGGHTPMVLVEDYVGGILLSHVEVVG